MPESPSQSSAPRTLVIVTGAGRSGTSTVAGTLKYLGLTVPKPEVKANATNPRGFFEPRWVVDFHKHLLSKAGVRTLDARPEAAEIAGRFGARPRPRRELADWLEAAFESPQIVVKDPRTFWFKDLWTEAAEVAGARITFLTMLRQPTEVVGSRDTHYQTRLSAEERRNRETGILAGWVNGMLVNEHASRGHDRVFVHYPDLIESWRTAMQAVGSTLDLRFNADLASNEPHEVDSFIDRDLRRVRLTWDDLDVPRYLRELAETTWAGLSSLAKRPDDTSAQQALDDARAEYLVVHNHAKALAHDATASAVAKARRQERRAARARAENEAAAAQRATDSRGLARRVLRRVRTLRGRSS